MAARANWNISDTLNAARRDTSEVLALAQRECGKMPGYMPERIDYFVRVLVSALPLLAPEREIRDSALDKAIRAVENPKRHPRPLPTWGSSTFILLRADVSKKCDNPPRDKRSKLDLELFVLALVQRDVNTPYQLLATAGLSPGATLPVLGRLEESGYVRRGKPGSRGRTAYEITPPGNRYLNTGWRPLLEAPPSGDIETILRTATLAVLSSADEKTVSSYLKKAAETKAADSKRRKSEAKAAEAAFAAKSDTALYGWMQARHAVARLASEAKVLRQLATALDRRTDVR